VKRCPDLGQKELKAVVAAATTLSPTSAVPKGSVPPGADYHNGVIHSLKEGYGLILPSAGPPNISFSMLK
jgi:hypothetical protein